MKTLSTTEESDLLEAVKSAVDAVDTLGLDPNDAVVKVAKDMKLSPGFVKAAVSAYNNGRQLAQFAANTDVLDKFAEFELADYDVIHEKLWGGSTKQAADGYRSRDISDYQSGPEFIRKNSATTRLGQLVKTAAAQEPAEFDSLTANDPEHQALLDAAAARKKSRKAYNRYATSRTRLQDKQIKVAEDEDSIREKLGNFERYLNKLAYDRLAFHEVDSIAKAYFGASGRSLMDVMASRLPKEKRAADVRSFNSRPVNENSEPFRLIKQAIDAAKRFHQDQRELVAAEAEFKEASDLARPYMTASENAPNETDVYNADLLGEKSAFFNLVGASAIGAGTRSMFDKALGPAEQKRHVQKVVADLDDPEHMDELRRIRAETLLARIMGDQDNPISGYSPEQVFNAYNEISQIAPRIAENSASLQPVLAKRLAGNTEPFEVQEMTKLEQGLKDVRQAPRSTSLMDDKNDNSFLG